ncbi:MAG: hypothetical protein IJ877_03195 [Candidatus Gastranaerophilales bacterium]|nr:hypothetical protein [Candidatus Gastranaerophilales bacterium]
MNIKKSIIGFLLLTFCLISGADASKLPDDVWKYIKSNLPDAKQRFDSVVTLKNDIMYIPLYPPALKEVEKIETEYTYPLATPLKQMPEVVLFNNGYALLKVFKDENGNYTLTKKDDLPIKVRLGLMPQDMRTPVGLKMPESLKLTLGDLLIPSKDETSLTKLDDNQKSPYSPAIKRNEFISGAEFKDKKIFINPKNSKFLEVYDNSSVNPLYELKLSAMPQKIITNSSNEVALIIYWNSKDIDIINLKDENVIAKINVDNIPNDAVLNKKENIVYVASSLGQAVYVIDLNSAKLSKVIKLDQKPFKIAYCELDNSISFYDEYLSRVFNLTKGVSDYVVQPIGEVKNLSVILSDVANIYGISRTDSEIHVFDKTQAKFIQSYSIDKKPTDAIFYDNKIYALCSKEGYIDVFDTLKNKVITREKLPEGEFYSKLTIIPDEKNILITGLSAKNYLIYDIENIKLSKKQDSYVNVSNIIITNKNQGL